MTISAIYLRISADKGKATGESGLAVDRQETEIRKMLDRKGWKAGKVYTDNDVTASGKRRRPEYERMVDDFRAGEVQAISAWDLDRLWRVPAEFEELLSLVDKQGLMLATVGGDADLSTDNGILYARIKVAVAADELRKRAARQKAKFAQDRETGKNHWRGRRPFGLELDGSLNEVEAQALRTIAEKVLNGATLSACVAFLNDQGIPTTFGGQWDRNPLKRIMLHPRLIGKMEHEGELVPGNWEAVLDEETWRAVGMVLTTRPLTQTKNTEKEYLLSGVATCGKTLEDGGTCGARLYGARVRREAKGRAESWVYRCSDTPTHLSKTMVRTDQHVVDMTLSILMVPGAEDEYRTEDTTEKLKALRNARAEEVASWALWTEEAAEEGLRPSEYRKPRERHEARLAEIDAQILDLTKTQVLDVDLEALTLVSHFDSFPLEQRRRILSTVWQSIVIHPSRRGARWSSEQIVMTPTAQTQTVIDSMKAAAELQQKMQSEGRMPTAEELWALKQVAEGVTKTV